MTSDEKQPLRRADDDTVAPASPWPARRVTQHNRDVKREAVIRRGSRLQCQRLSQHLDR